MVAPGDQRERHPVPHRRGRRRPAGALLHGFPQFWWTWRSQLVTLADAGYRAVAADLRGYGGSDKPPRGYDLITAASDAAGLIRSLGEANAVVIGHDWGGLVAWTMAAYYPKVVRRLGVVSMAHPLRMRSALLTDPLGQGRRSGYAFGFQVPVLPEHSLVRDHAQRVGQMLRAWSGPGWPDPETERRYRTAMCIPSVAHSALEYHRWFMRSRLRPDGLRYAQRMRAPIQAPTLHLHGLAGHLRAARDRARRRPARGRPVPLAAARRVRAFPARGAARSGSTPSCAAGWPTQNPSDDRQRARSGARPGPGQLRAAAEHPAPGRAGRPLPPRRGRRRNGCPTICPSRQPRRWPWPSNCSTAAARSTRTRCWRRPGSRRRPRERELWRGLAQLAVGLTHAQRGNDRGAAALLRRGAERVGGYAGAAPYDIDAAGLSAAARALADRIEAGGLAGLDPHLMLTR